LAERMVAFDADVIYELLGSVRDQLEVEEEAKERARQATDRQELLRLAKEFRPIQRQPASKDSDSSAARKAGGTA